MNRFKKYSLVIASVLLLFACKKLTEPFTPKAPAEDKLLDGPAQKSLRKFKVTNDDKYLYIQLS